jgi:hypothetical protein
MLETHIVMSSLISRLVLTLTFCLTLLLMLCLVAHIILVHEKTTLCLDALFTTYVLIMMIISRAGLVSLLEGLTLTLS